MCKNKSVELIATCVNKKAVVMPPEFRLDIYQAYYQNTVKPGNSGGYVCCH